MPLTSVGDGAQQFLTMRNGGAIKTELFRLAESLSTGRVNDITAELGGDTNRLSGINYSLAQIDGFAQVVSETSQMLAGIQTVLGKVDTVRSDTGAKLLLLSDASTGAQVDEAGRAARSSFETIVDTLNTRLADRSLMAGTAVDRMPLASAESMLADITASLAGATTVADITTAIDTWFDDPAGGFATMGYLGDSGAPLERRVAEHRKFQIDARADDPALRDVLKATAMAAIAEDVAILDIEAKSDLLREAGERLFASATGIVAVQARIGFAEAAIEQTEVELNAQKTALEISKNDLISADPFETASRLQNIQLQLETHYSVTARLSRLSLLDYI